MRKYNVVDLFCGMGGGAIGIESVGNFNQLLAIDNNIDCVNTYNLNLKEKVAINKDITKLTDFDYLNLVDNKKVDILIGSPSCQGFSIITRNKSVSESYREEKNSLVFYYLKAVKVYKPLICVIENVKGLLSMKNKNGKLVINEIESEFIRLGYHFKYKVINVSKIGGVQKRERVIIFASKNKSIFDNFNYPTEYKNNLTIKDVIYKYEKETVNNNLGNPKFKNHNIPQMKDSTIKKIKLIKENQSIVDLKRLHPNLKLKGYFTNSYKRESYNSKTSTIINICKTMSIHPKLDRIYSVREGLALQGFNDEFYFNDNIKVRCQYQMVANAIPPILTEKVFKEIKRVLDNYYDEK